ncbi:LOW QUALITY PROTEIN: uncharacterized protein LOC119093241 [Pollicipes pollicipes]|uniref:LOW QUALITY PROTEIN: uncharacterized protein LOC119093241 n=1 Tax=Pollicipes pollicipes TaxID=41117 RepID=UPI0018858A4F|nr:LOW QUALITY PROTEIN: uncharacterized protein LOC119093241 [Pollicipes pollicipes]
MTRRLQLILLLLAVTDGLPQRPASEEDPDSSSPDAVGAASARLLRVVAPSQSRRNAALKRHVTRPESSSGGRRGSLKVIRRRKVAAPTTTERSFGAYLEPPFLALLNDSHFSLQPEFLLAQGLVGEHQLQPFIGFGRRLGSGEVQGAQALGSTRSEVVSGAGEDARGRGRGRGATQGLSEDRLKARRKAVRGGGGITPEAAPLVSETITTKPAAVKRVGTNATAPAVENEIDSPRKLPLADGEVSATELNNVTTPTPPDAEATSVKTSADVTPTTDEATATTTHPSLAAFSVDGLTSADSTTTEVAPAAADEVLPPTHAEVEHVSAPAPSGKAEGDSNVAAVESPSTATVSTEAETSAHPPQPRPSERPARPTSGGVESASPSRRPPSALIRGRLGRYRSRLQGVRGGRRRTSTTPPPPPEHKEKQEVSKVLGLLAKIRNRTRVSPALIARGGAPGGAGRSRVGDGTESPAGRAASPAPSAARPAGRADTTPADATSDSPEGSSRPPTSSTAAGPSPASPSEAAADVPTTSEVAADVPPTSEVAADVPTTSEVAADVPTTSEVAADVLTTVLATPQSSSSTERGTSRQTAGRGGPSSRKSSDARRRGRPEAVWAGAASTSENTASAERRRRLESLRRAYPVENKSSQNLLARRLRQRQNVFSALGGDGGHRAASTGHDGGSTAAALPAALLPTMAPLPILLSTLPAPFRAGLITAPPLRRNFTVSVTFPPTSQTTVRTGGRSPGGGGAAVTSAGQPAGRVLGTSLQTSVSVAVSPLEFKLRKRVSLAQAANEARGRDAGDSVAAGKRQGSDAQRAGGGRASGEVSEGDTARTSGPSGESSALPELDDPPAPSTTTERSRNASTTQTYSPTPEQSFDQFTVRAPRLSLAEVAAAADASNRTRHTSPTSTASSHWQEEDELVQRVLDAGPTSSTAPPSAASSPLPSVGRRRPAVREVFAEEVLLTEEAESRPLYLVSLLFVLPVVAVALWYLKKNHLDMRQLVPQRLKSMLGPDSSDVTRDDVTRDDFYLPTEETSSKVATMLIQDTLARRRKWEQRPAAPAPAGRPGRGHFGQVSATTAGESQAVLGEGHFGQVWRAEADGVRGHEGTLLVAVKNVKTALLPKISRVMLRSIAIYNEPGQPPNVVTLLGCGTEEDPVLVVMEYVVFGKLLTYLRENRGRHNYFNFSHDSAVLTSRDLTLFACQAAAGMEYIAAQGCIVHRDLAARNILVDHNKVCKVSDFGMSRSQQEISSEVFEQNTVLRCFHQGALPIRWMSPESLYHNTFNQKTDCWSFGILLWEIITLGSTPYPGLSAREVMRSVREGYRLERPDHCHPQLYQLAASCWAAEPSWRPSFAELRNDLEVLLEDQKPGLSRTTLLLLLLALVWAQVLEYRAEPVSPTTVRTVAPFPRLTLCPGHRLEEDLIIDLYHQLINGSLSVVEFYNRTTLEILPTGYDQLQIIRGHRGISTVPLPGPLGVWRQRFFLHLGRRRWQPMRCLTFEPSAALHRSCHSPLSVRLLLHVPVLFTSKASQVAYRLYVHVRRPAAHQYVPSSLAEDLRGRDCPSACRGVAYNLNQESLTGGCDDHGSTVSPCFTEAFLTLDLAADEVQEAVAFTQSTLLADIGGFLGLVTGFSLLALADMAEALVCGVDSSSPDAVGAASARLLRVVAPSQSRRNAALKRHVTRPESSSGGRRGSLKVIRRRKAAAPTTTERSFGAYLEPPFLALLNDSHFSLQPEFLLAQGLVGEHQLQPFIGFGRRLGSGEAQGAQALGSTRKHKEKQEVSKVLGLLAKIRNRTRVSPALIARV